MQKLLLPGMWVIALVGVFILSSSFSDKSQHFFGIAGEREQAIKFQYPVEIVQVFGIEGTEVKQGQNILEVRRHQLDSNLLGIAQEIRRYQLQNSEIENNINSQLANLKAKKLEVIANMDYQVHVLEHQMNINLEMIKSISENPEKNVIVRNTELDDLKKKRHFSIQAIEAEIDGLMGQLNASHRPIDAKIRELYSKKVEMQRQSVSLKVKAKFDGRIGSVNFKAGELASPYQSIISVHSRIPRFVKGYINENILNDVKIGQTVWVNTIVINKNQSSLRGIVESLGNRIVEYPERLKKNTLVSAWGREVVVRLKNPENTLLFGEKVQVFLEPPEVSFEGFNAIKNANAIVPNTDKTLSLREITSKDKKIKAKKIEASGILWNPIAAHYLLVSDESYKHHADILIMDENGIVSARLSMKNNEQHAMNDIESISTDGEYFYALSSLSRNKKDKLKSSRQKLLRFKYSNKQITEQKDIDLYGILNVLKDLQTTDLILASFLKQAIDNHSIDIEAHFVRNNNLYLGFKSPLATRHQTLIVKLHNVNAMFEGKNIQADIWQAIDLRDPETGEPMLLSDMTLENEQLFLLSVSRSSVKKSVLWQYHLKNKSLENIKQFPELKAEGISYRPEKSMFTVVFDEGKKNKSKYITFSHLINPQN